MLAAIPERMITIPDRMAKRVAGCGSALPPRSTVERKTVVQSFRKARRFRIFAQKLKCYPTRARSPFPTIAVGFLAMSTDLPAVERQRQVAASVGVRTARHTFSFVAIKRNQNAVRKPVV